MTNKVLFGKSKSLFRVFSAAKRRGESLMFRRNQRLGVFAGVLIVLVSAFLFFAGKVQASANILRFPLDNYNVIADYGIKNSSLPPGNSCYGIDWRNLYHAGEDASAPAGTPVKAIADGEVVYVHPVQADYPGSFVLLRHDISGSIFYSGYGHLQEYPNMPVSENQTVSKGQVIGYVLYQGSNSHLHFEIRTFHEANWLCGDGNVAGPGYTIYYPDFPNPSEQYTGYTNPTDFINLVNGGVNKVQLYQHALFRGARENYSAGQFNVGSNDQTSSVAIPYGWSAHLRKDTNQSGPYKYMEYSDINFDNDTYNDGTSLNDSISSLEVFVLQCVQSSGARMPANVSLGGFLLPWFTSDPCSPVSPTPVPGSTATPAYTPVPTEVVGNSHVDIFDGMDFQPTQYGWDNSTNGWFDLNQTNSPDYMNDKASSIEIDSGWSVLVSRDFGGSGGQKCFVASNSNLANATYDNGANINDSISSVRVFNNGNCDGLAAEGVSDGDTVTLHDDPNYWATEYGWHAAGPASLPDYIQNKATSVGVINGWSIAVYQDLNQQGGFACFTASDPDLTDNYLSNGEWANDNIESAYIYQDTNCGGLNDPPSVSISYTVTDTSHNLVEVGLSWSNAASDWQILDWGDSANVGNFGSSGTEMETHIYSSPGSYTLTFTVKGINGNTYPTTQTVNIPGLSVSHVYPMQLKGW